MRPQLDVMINDRILPQYRDADQPDDVIVIAEEEMEYRLKVTSSEKILVTAKVDGQRVLMTEKDNLPVWPGKPRYFQGFERSIRRALVADGVQHVKEYEPFIFCRPPEGGLTQEGTNGFLESVVSFWNMHKDGPEPTEL